LFYRFPFPSSPQPLLTKPIRNITPLWWTVAKVAALAVRQHHQPHCWMEAL
jgi:hypothetical protein